MIRLPDFTKDALIIVAVGMAFAVIGVVFDKGLLIGSGLIITGIMILTVFLGMHREE